jgi:paraquat-inducible protein B
MSKQASPALIGSFVLGGAALLVIFVLIIAGDSFLKEERRYVIYFEGTIFGLKVGSNVMFRGVPIGYVADIDVLADFANMEFTVPVTITIQPDTIRALTDERELRIHADEDVTRLIESGLRATLASESLITGQLYIELDFHPETEIVYRGIADDVPEIPSIPSGIQEVVAKAQTFAADIQENVDVPKIAADISNALEGLDKFINSAETQNVTAEISETLAALRSTLDTLDATVADVGGDIDPALIALTNALESAENVLTLAETQLQDDSDIAYRIGTTLKEVESAARAIRILAEQLEQQPESVLKGKK